MNKMNPSKMQKILDEVEKDLEKDRYGDAIRGLIDAIKLISRGQQQVMGDVGSLNRGRTDIPIGSK